MQPLPINHLNSWPENKVDLCVVGLGPAGVACLIQAHRDGLSVMGIGDEPVGGLVTAARRLDNLPGFPGVSGRALADSLLAQIKTLGIPIQLLLMVFQQKSLETVGT